LSLDNTTFSRVKNPRILQPMSLLLLFLVVGCCKLIVKQAEIRVKLVGYSFSTTDSIRVSYFNTTLLPQESKPYPLSPNQAFVFTVNDTDSQYTMVTLVNTRLGIRDTLRAFNITTETVQRKCPGISQTKVSFTARGKVYAPSASIDLTLTR